jgi:hypothetical protein
MLPRVLSRLSTQNLSSLIFLAAIFRTAALAEEGKLFDETGKWRPGLRGDQLQVPEGVRLVLGRRLDRLGTDARRILTTGAVIGRSFSLRLLEALENAQPDAALDPVEEAERAHLVSAEPAAGRETRYRFVHELVRQTLAEALSLPRRQRLHARVADAIERVYAANPDAHVSALAHHLYFTRPARPPIPKRPRLAWRWPPKRPQQARRMRKRWCIWKMPSPCSRAKKACVWPSSRRKRLRHCAASDGGMKP